MIYLIHHFRYTPKFAWKDTYFPNYCNGPTYLLSSAAVPAILNQTTTSYLITVEDALFTGILAEKAGVKRMNYDRIFAKQISLDTGCNDEVPSKPWIVSGYGFSDSSFIYKENASNPMSIATQSLFGLSC